MSITVNLRYTGKGNAAIDFAREMTESGVVEKIRAEKGNLRYEYYQRLFDISPDKTVLLIDQWENQEAIDIHHASPMHGRNRTASRKVRPSHDGRAICG